MSRESIYFYKDIGEVIYRRKSGVRRLTIKIKEDGVVRVTIPYLTAFSSAEKFVLSKSDWIIKTLDKIHQSNPEPFIINDQMEFHTFSHQLRVIRCEGEKFKRRLLNGCLEVSLPFHADITSSFCQTFIKDSITETYRYEAKQFLPVRVDQFAVQHGFSYNRVSVKNMKTRWGSCSGKNNINLNIHLMSLPEELRDYVILHELAHTREKNHGPKFWALLESLCPESKKFRKELRDYSGRLREMIV